MLAKCLVILLTAPILFVMVGAVWIFTLSYAENLDPVAAAAVMVFGVFTIFGLVRDYLKEVWHEGKLSD